MKATVHITKMNRLTRYIRIEYLYEIYNEFLTFKKSKIIYSTSI